jgi:hypothetical protein
VLLTACSPSYAFRTTTATTATTAPPREAQCRFDILTVAPSRPFDEVGIVEGHASPWGVGVNDVDEFREQIARAVCSHGADAVLAEINGFGQYVRGTLIHYRAADAAPPASPAGAPL